MMINFGLVLTLDKHQRNIYSPKVIYDYLDDNNEDNTMWKKPEFEDMRLGMEITLYISNR